MSKTTTSQLGTNHRLPSDKLLQRQRIRLLPAAFPVPLSGLWESSVAGGIDLAVIVTNRCKSACAHCYNNSGPKGSFEVSSEKLRRLIDQGTVHNIPISRIGFSGGEPLLYDALFELSERSADRGISVSCITGGIGGHLDQIIQLAKSGVRRFTFSIDKYHAEFVSDEQISELINLTVDIFPEVAVQISSTSTHEGLDLANRFAERLDDRIEIAVMPVTGIGRAVRLVGKRESEIDDNHLTSEAMVSGRKVTVNFDEWIYSNCSLDGFIESNRVCHLNDLLEY